MEEISTPQNKGGSVIVYDAVWVKDKTNQVIVSKKMNLKVYVCIFKAHILAYGCFFGRKIHIVTK